MIVFRITKLMSDGEATNAWGTKVLADEDHPIWGVGDHDDWTWVSGGTRRGCYYRKRLGDRYWAIEKEGRDDYEIIPPEEWPDDVCAHVAMLALVGDDEEEEFE